MKFGTVCASETVHHVNYRIGTTNLSVYRPDGMNPASFGQRLPTHCLQWLYLRSLRSLQDLITWWYQPTNNIKEHDTKIHIIELGFPSDTSISHWEPHSQTPSTYIINHPLCLSPTFILSAGGTDGHSPHCCDPPCPTLIPPPLVHEIHIDTGSHASPIPYYPWHCPAAAHTSRPSPTF